MKKTINFWAINFFLTVVTAFLCNGGVFASNTGVIPLTKGGLGAIKLSFKGATYPIEGEGSISHRSFSNQWGQGKWSSAQQKGKR